VVLPWGAMSPPRGQGEFASITLPSSERQPAAERPLPPVDERLVAPDTIYEIVEGRVFEVMGSYEPHAAANSLLAYVLGAAVRPGFRCAVDMLTRVGALSDFAPDVSVFPEARDEQTGGRQLEHMAFEVRDSQALSDVTRKAELLAARGVRRVFCVEVRGPRLLAWEQGGWRPLADGDFLEDATCLIKPLSVRALLDAAEADNEAARALMAKGNSVIAQALERQLRDGLAAGLRDGLAEGLRDGRAAGLRDGLAEGLRDGRAAGLRDAVADLCEVLGVELDDSRRKHLASLDVDGLEALRAALKRERRWG
jgi:hypothetical protein